MPLFRLSEIAHRIGASVEGGADPEIRGVSGIREAETGHITFLSNPRYLAYAASTNASAIIVARDYSNEGGRVVLRVEDPYLAFLHVMHLFGGDRPVRPVGIHPTAVIGEGVTLGVDVAIGAHVVVEAGARLGDRSVLMPGVFVGEKAEIGDEAFLYPNVVLREACRIGKRVIVHPGAVIGSDGFGYARDGDVNRKIPQLGIVVVEDDVEIGANVTIDRATTGITLIHTGVRIDNLVQIAHNVVIGENSIICAQVGVSGSTEVGKSVVLGGQAGLVGHIRIGDRTMIGAQAGVTKSIPPDTRVSGYPATEHEAALKIQAHTRRLPELAQTIKELKTRLEELERELEKERQRENVL